MINLMTDITPIFQLGTICWTRGINQRIVSNAKFTTFFFNSLSKHAEGDWGDIDLEGLAGK